MIKSFDRRYPEHTIRHALKELVGPSVWRSDALPKLHLHALAKCLATGEEDVARTAKTLEEEWI